MRLKNEIEEDKDESEENKEATTPLELLKEKSGSDCSPLLFKSGQSTEVSLDEHHISKNFSLEPSKYIEFETGKEATDLYIENKS